MDAVYDGGHIPIHFGDELVAALLRAFAFCCARWAYGDGIIAHKRDPDQVVLLYLLLHFFHLLALRPFRGSCATDGDIGESVETAVVLFQLPLEICCSRTQRTP